MKTGSTKNISIQIKGLVQGVGFRPFIYRTAIKFNISGWVKNQQDGIFIEASGKSENIESFTFELKSNFPVAAHMHDFLAFDSDVFHNNGFQIMWSDESESENEITQIGPDIAVCKECLQEMKTHEHRIQYPFINCTNCGPRFSIIRDLPYDRDKTTMDKFNMCPVCKSEYKNPADRRFHAQPVACKQCGPHYTFSSKEIETNNPDEVLFHTKKFIDSGKIVAIKGIGGFFMACDARNGNATERLRRLKNREGKPFAVMFRDINAAKEFCCVNEKERHELTSWQRPIVILNTNKELLDLLPQSVSNGISTVGALLPYMPFHYLLFERLNTSAIVFTSGNISDEPIVISNKKAKTDLLKICDAVVSYNREIYNRTDDSLMQIINEKPRLMRRSRGYAPNPVYLKFDVNGILATGAELKNTFCLGKGKQAILSQHTGDLKNFETWCFYEKNMAQFQKMFRVNPKLIVTDLHPGYLSTKYGQESALPIIQVQHHHAHIASAMAEHGLDEKVIGISFDGTGYGDDGNLWGSEFFVCDLIDYERKFHFDYIPLPGGDSAIKEPWKIAVSILYGIFNNEFLYFDLPFLKTIPKEKINWVLKALDKKINCPLSSGSGRLFDAVSALLGLCGHTTFEAEAPMRLENIIAPNENNFYSFELSQIIDFSEMFAEIIRDLQKNIDLGVISAKFHNTVSKTIVEGAEKIKRETAINKVVLSGGTFQNRYVTEKTENKLSALGFEVFANCSIPCNDGGISLGQIAIAAKRQSVGH